MRRIVYALVLIVGSTAPVVGVASARAQEPCAALTTTDTVTSLGNAYVFACVPYDVPPSNGACTDRDVSASDPESFGTIGVDIDVIFCLPM